MTGVEAAVAGEILRIARDELRLEGESPTFDEPLSGRFDSLMLLSLVVAVEDRFHVALTDDDAAAIRTLAELSRIVAARAPADRLPSLVEVRP